MIAAMPPMGWNSWNTFYDNISEELVFAMADAMAESGLAEAGYKYLIIDDCWSEKERDNGGNLVPDRKKFPGGMKKVADYVHSKGLKFGMYSCCGVRTCADYPGSFEHEYADARQFASWGVDYLKYDNGYRPSSLATPLLYRRMAMALRDTGRDVLFAACQWGSDDVTGWIRSSGAHTFRSTIDIQDNWDSISSIAKSQLDAQCFNAPGCFNDMDMLVVGMYGKGQNPETSGGKAGCSDTEYETHMALWAMMNSPLIIGCDIRSMNDHTASLLMNKDLISINQDIEARGCYHLPVYANNDAFILVRPLSDGDYAIGFFNYGEKDADITLDLWDIGLTITSGTKNMVYDCFSHDIIGEVIDRIACKTLAHGCRVFKLTRCSLHKDHDERRAS